jgi:hypothetical protein
MSISTFCERECSPADCFTEYQGIAGITIKQIGIAIRPAASLRR